MTAAHQKAIVRAAVKCVAIDRIIKKDKDSDSLLAIFRQWRREWRNLVGLVEKSGALKNRVEELEAELSCNKLRCQSAEKLAGL